MAFMDFFTNLDNSLTNDVALDIGTSTTLIYEAGRGIVLREPSVIAIDNESKKCLAVGSSAKKMLGRTPEEIKAVRPIKDGVIIDFEMEELMLRMFINMIRRKRFFKRPSIVVSVHSAITEVEKKALSDSAKDVGAKNVHLVSESVAAAIGAGLPVLEPINYMIINIGGGLTEIAVISRFEIVMQNSIRIAGDEMDDAIIQYVRNNYNIMVGEQTAEEVKIKAGKIIPTIKNNEIEVKGRDLASGLPKTIKLLNKEVRDAIRKPVLNIVEAVHLTLEKIPKELFPNVLKNGIYMTGGCSLIRGIDLLIREETNLPVMVAKNAQESVVLGAGKILENTEKYKKVIFNRKNN
jgi:rod shape-determining protein MreB